jgi:hypothetical protein
MLSAAVPPLLKVTIWAVLGVPANWLVKLSLVGLREAAGAETGGAQNI